MLFSDACKKIDMWSVALSDAAVYSMSIFVYAALFLNSGDMEQTAVAKTEQKQLIRMSMNF